GDAEKSGQEQHRRTGDQEQRAAPMAADCEIHDRRQVEAGIRWFCRLLARPEAVPLEGLDHALAYDETALQTTAQFQLPDLSGPRGQPKTAGKPKEEFNWRSPLRSARLSTASASGALRSGQSC